jgi:hypothetical protein
MAQVERGFQTGRSSMAGWFADDLGSLLFTDLDSFPDKAAYRAGAIALAQTLPKVANTHGLIFVVNGTQTRESPV